MSAGAAGGGLHRSMLEGCISGGDTSIQRRPYHKNCKCALHRERGGCGRCTHSSPYSTVSYPIRRNWSDGSLSLVKLSNSTAVAAAVRGEISRTHTQLVLFEEDGEVD